MPEQLKMVSLKCSNCGGSLEIAGDMERFACGYCGSELIVQRRGGTIGLRLVGDAVARVQVGTDKTAAELALVRPDKELATARAQRQEADRQFTLRNKPNSSLFALMILFLPFVFLGALGSFFTGPREVDIGAMLGSLLLGGGAIVGFRWALKEPAKAKKRYITGRSELWGPHGKEIQWLEMQIGKQRRLVHS